MIEYQVEPDFQVGQLVPQDDPVTVPETVTLLESPSDVLTVELVEAPVRKFAAEHAGDIVSEDAEMGATAMRTSMTAVRNAVIQREVAPRPFVAVRSEAWLEDGVVVCIGSPWSMNGNANSTTQQAHADRLLRSWSGG